MIYYSLYYTILYNSILYATLHDTALHYSTLHYTTLHYTILLQSPAVDVKVAVTVEVLVVVVTTCTGFKTGAASVAPAINHNEIKFLTIDTSQFLLISYNLI